MRFVKKQSEWHGNMYVFLVLLWLAAAIPSCFEDDIPINAATASTAGEWLSNRSLAQKLLHMFVLGCLIMEPPFAEQS